MKVIKEGRRSERIAVPRIREVFSPKSSTISPERRTLERGDNSSQKTV